MNRATTVLVIAGLVLFVGSAFGVEKCDKSCPHHATCVGGKETKQAAVTLKGEIVEAGCFVERGQRAADDPECIKRCISNGMPMALLGDDNSVYLIVKSQDAVKAYERAIELAAQKVELKGFVYEKSGLKAVAVTEVKPLGIAVR
jgi:hypothetical protein